MLRRLTLSKNHNLWIVLLGGLFLVSALVLALESPGWAASDRSARDTVPTRTPTPTLVPQAYLPVVVRSPSSSAQETMRAPRVLPRGPSDLVRSVEQIPSCSQVSSTDVGLKCRYGVATWNSLVDQIPIFEAGWYLDFGAHSTSGPDGVEFVQVIRVKQNKEDGNYLPGYSVNPSLTEEGLGTLVAAHPGALWIIGNEPDRGPDPGGTSRVQDDTYPQVYAIAYGDVYQFIKQRDPTAQIAVAGLVEVTPGRLQYLDKVWEAYRENFGVSMPVDVWNMHIYILPEATHDGQPNGVANIALGTDPSLAMRSSDPENPDLAKAKCGDPENDIYCWADHDNLDIFADQVVKMRTWMKQHGQQNKPLILSEYSILYPFEDYDDPVNPSHCFLQDEYGGCFTAARVSSFMTRTFNYLETAVDEDLGYPVDDYRLVQQWLWFSIRYDGAGYVSNLLDGDCNLTQVGQTFQDYVTTLPVYVNLFPDHIRTVVETSVTDTVTVTLSVSVRNNGNTRASGPLTVTFYSDEGLAQPIGSGVLSDLGGCARQAATVETTWADLADGPHPFWVKVDSSEAITEGLETDNLTQGMVLINPHQVFLPLILRGE